MRAFDELPFDPEYDPAYLTAAGWTCRSFPEDAEPSDENGFSEELRGEIAYTEWTKGNRILASAGEYVYLDYLTYRDGL